MKLPQISFKRGFTLIELLVVITIIIILAAVVMIAINPAEMARRGRDATRLSDLENVRKAIDLAVAEMTATIPACGTARGSSSTGTTCGGVACNRICNDANNWICGMDVCSYLATLPVDPQDPTGEYQFHTNATTGTYEIRVQLESTSNDGKETGDGGNDPTWYEVGTEPGLDLMP